MMLYDNNCFISLVPGRIVFVKSISKKEGSNDKSFKLSPVVLVESFSKDKSTVLALSLDEISVLKDDDNELWEDDDAAAELRFTALYEKTNATYEALIEKLKNFKTNEVQIPFKFSSLATFKSIQSATLIQVKYSDIQAIANRFIQKNPQLNFDFSFLPIWYQHAQQQQSRNLKFVQYKTQLIIFVLLIAIMIANFNLI